jgi:heparosan-N-sulfate-glucuronate 5-epimerase
MATSSPTSPLPPALSRIDTVSRLARHLRAEVDDVLGRGALFGHQPPGPNLDSPRLRGYFCDFRHKALLSESQDLRAEEFSAFSGGVIPVAQTALGFWELLLEGGDVRRQFLERADWLMREARSGPRGEGLAWYTELPFAKYGLVEPWPSAMGQGEAMSVLLRAHDLTGERAYLEAARAAFAPLRFDVAEGGVTRRLDGRLVLEEYPTEQPCAILNGWIFALFGVHELGTNGHPPALELFAESVEGLLALLPRYDVGWWSRYSLYDHGRPDLAKPFYQRLHPVLLDGLAQIHGDPRLGAMARRWERQLTAHGIARNAANKLSFRLGRELRDRRRAG